MKLWVCFFNFVDSFVEYFFEMTKKTYIPIYPSGIYPLMLPPKYKGMNEMECVSRNYVVTQNHAVDHFNSGHG